MKPTQLLAYLLAVVLSGQLRAVETNSKPYEIAISATGQNEKTWERKGLPFESKGKRVVDTCAYLAKMYFTPICSELPESVANRRIDFSVSDKERLGDALDNLASVIGGHTVIRYEEQGLVNFSVEPPHEPLQKIISHYAVTNAPLIQVHEWLARDHYIQMQTVSEKSALSPFENWRRCSVNASNSTLRQVLNQVVGSAGGCFWIATVTETNCVVIYPTLTLRP